jgi:hypothetical protein
MKQELLWHLHGVCRGREAGANRLSHGVKMDLIYSHVAARSLLGTDQRAASVVLYLNFDIRSPSRNYSHLNRISVQSSSSKASPSIMLWIYVSLTNTKCWSSSRQLSPSCERFPDECGAQ